MPDGSLMKDEEHALEDKKKDNEEALAKLDPASLKMLIEGMMGGIELAKYEGIDFTPRKELGRPLKELWMLERQNHPAKGE
jgi:hypothetical protein